MFRISPTTGLSLFKECPRCFWLHYNEKIHRPRGIFPSLPGGMDSVIKRYFDKYRGEMIPEIRGEIKGILMPDLDLLNKWRDWRTGLEYKDEKRDAVLFGALDDCLIDNGQYIVLDYKTRGYPVKEGDSEKYYQTQMDTYSFLLSENGYNVGDFAYLVYYYPEKVMENGIVGFNIKAVKVSTDLKRAKNTFEQAVDLLGKPAPEKHSDCEYCSWISDRSGFE